MMVFCRCAAGPRKRTSFTQDYAYARSAEVIHGPVMQALVWARVPGDLVFAVGAGAFAWFVARAFLSRGRK
jgi:nitric oxide reductase subunit B